MTSPFTQNRSRSLLCKSTEKYIQKGAVFDAILDPLWFHLRSENVSNPTKVVKFMLKEFRPTFLLSAWTNFGAFCGPGQLFEEIYLDFYNFWNFFSTRNLRFRNTLHAKRLFVDSCFSFHNSIF